MKHNIGLRERKRVQTRRRLEEAAIGLALRDGLERVTVDAISERAEVSPRTFFNYFDSKDDAVLGVRPPDVGDDMLIRHRARYDGADLVESLVGLLITVLGPSIDEPAMHESRLEVVRQNPQLMERLMGRMSRMTEQLTAAATSLIAHHRGGRDVQPVSEGVAQTLLMTCAGGIRAATRVWSTSTTDRSLEELEQRAVALVREAIEKLS